MRVDDATLLLLPSPLLLAHMLATPLPDAPPLRLTVALESTELVLLSFGELLVLAKALPVRETSVDGVAE